MLMLKIEKRHITEKMNAIFGLRFLNRNFLEGRKVKVLSRKQQAKRSKKNMKPMQKKNKIEIKIMLNKKEYQ